MTTRGQTITSPVSQRVRPQLGQISRKLVVLVLMVNATLSLIATGAQLYLQFQRDKAEVIGTLTTIDHSLRSGFETALWEFNFTVVEALLDGLMNKSDVAYVHLETPLGQSWVRGLHDPDYLIVHELDFHHLSSGSPQIVGHMTIGLSLEVVKTRIWAQFWTIMASNFTKAAVASFVLLVAFNRIVTRHLHQIVTYVRTTSWLDSENVLELDRRPKTPADEIDEITNAINTARERGRADYNQLAKETRMRTQAEERLALKAGSLEAANKEQAAFTYAISHDLKSPANTMQMLLQEITLTEKTALSAEGQELLGMAQGTARRMSRLVDDVLAYARTVETRVTKLPVDMNQLLCDVVDDLASDITQNGASVRIDTLPEVRGSAMQLRLLMQNLIANAVKFRAADHPCEVVISGAVVRDEGIVRLTVTDNGIGIPEEHQTRVFELFQRLHTHDEIEGSGLGLSLCQRVVSNHDGRISVASSPDQGATFTVELPL